MLELEAPMGYELMMRYIDIMCDRYRAMSMNYIGESIFGRGIPMLTLGNGKKQVMYIGGLSGKDTLSAMMLLRFVNEYCEIKNRGGRIYNYSVDYLFATRRVCVIPMLNTDGAEININGVSEENIMRERLLSMNGGDDFSQWSANGRGVSLNRNFNCGFAEYKSAANTAGLCTGAPDGYCGECPESEPETGALCSNIRYSGDLKAALSISQGGERILYKTKDKTPVRGKSLAEAMSRMSGYKLQSEDDLTDTYGSFFGWCAEELSIPAFDIRCGKVGTKYPETYFELYARVREILFTLPALI
jgi:g-D-glutamyl-meso-diaminopimelate peptidase